jgi:hypothetical protein
MESQTRDDDEDFHVHVPSQMEMLKLLHITDCELIAPAWQDAWALCPVCGGQRGEDGFVRHKRLKN